MDQGFRPCHYNNRLADRERRFILLRGLGLYDTQAAIFVLRQWFMTIPRELDDAAKMDGAGHVRILWHVILPLSIPPVGALRIPVAERAWNSFFWPNIVLASPSKSPSLRRNTTA